MVNSCPNREGIALLQAAHAQDHQGVGPACSLPWQPSTLAGSTLPRDIAHRDGCDTPDYNYAGIGRGAGAPHDPAAERTVLRFSTATPSSEIEARNGPRSVKN